MKRCLLEDTKECIECGECDRCDLDPNKLCDNCCKCINEWEGNFAEIPVQDIVTEQTEAYLQEFFEDEEEGEEDATVPAYELPDPALLAEWEEKLKAFEVKQQLPALRGVRKRCPRE